MKDREYFKNLKEALPFKAQADAARKFKISDSAVSQIASGKTENPDVLEYLLKRARDYQKYLNKVRTEIQGYGKKPEKEVRL